ncbi:MAG: hypothetical protein JNN28_07770 [Saprospiraceae bacterium]|nr:hypothetical protein [Saprospiraceae bacterium]
MIQLKIPEPCAEKWTSMTPFGPDCRYCAQCDKNIVDFTFKSDAEILVYLQQHQGRICGRFRADQLHRNIRAGRKKGWSIQAFVTGLIGLVSLPAWAQQDLKPLNLDQPIHQVDIPPALKDTLCRTITGKIVDPQTGDPLIGAVILYRNFGVVTDVDGVFRLRIPLSAFSSPDELIQVRYTGFEPLEIALPARILQEDLALLPQPMRVNEEFLGEVVVIRKRTPGTRIRLFLRKLFH